MQGKAEYTDSPIELLTEKQKEVMDLLIEHKTSKEIARILEISPHTVDQRIQFCKKKLGVATRGEAAVVYGKLKSIYDQMIYEDSRIGSSTFLLDKGSANEAERLLTLMQPNRIKADGGVEVETKYRVVPEMFDGRHGTFMRVGSVAVLAVLVIFIVLGGLAIFGEVSSMLAN